MMRIHYEIHGSTVVPDGSTISKSNPNEIIFPTGEKMLVGPWFNKIGLDLNRHYEFDIFRDDWTAEFRFEEQVEDDVLELTDPLPEEKSPFNDRLLSIPLPEVFASWVSNIGGSESTVYDLYFTSNKPPCMLYQGTNDAPYFKPEEVKDVVSRYTRLYSLLEKMSEAGYILRKLIMVQKSGRSGVDLVYLDHSGSNRSLEYIRDTGPEAMIPDDFLIDLNRLVRIN